jgi:hypothetical protein
MNRTAEALKAQYRAAALRRSGGPHWQQEATRLEAEALALRTPPEAPVVSSGEVVPAAKDPKAVAEWYVKNTLQAPDAVAAEASEARTKIAAELGVLEMAVDAAASIQAKNSLEKMLAHQLAATHDVGLRMLAQAAEQQRPVEAARLANAAARLLDVYREGFLAIHRVRTGGRQIVTVQHVTVADGGQAVVAGNIDQGASETGDGGKRGE